jgi:hypothetical protein
MRSERTEVMRRDPSSGTAVAEKPEPRPIKQFLEALEDFELTVSLHGPGSTQAHLARVHVRKLRELAADAWRTQR